MIDEKDLHATIRRWGDREAAAAEAFAQEDLAKIKRRLDYRRAAGRRLAGRPGEAPSRTERPHPFWNDPRTDRRRPVWNGLVAAAMALVLLVPACRIHNGRPPTALETAIDSTISALPSTDEFKSYVEVVATSAAAHLRERSRR